MGKFHFFSVYSHITNFHMCNMYQFVCGTRSLDDSACFLTAVESCFEKVDITAGSRDSVDSHLLHASPLHFLHAASHHMRNKHSLLSDRGSNPFKILSPPI
uniref:Uncharacterized protein n=1 Tax=Oryzias latipes TaxID=8090 RepID=A0A3B3HM88_ORYLA